MKLRVHADVDIKIKSEDILKSNVVYKLTFPNGKIYIGQTTRPLVNRVREHCNYSFRKNRYEYTKLISKAIRKYLSFSVDILYSGEDLSNNEINFISKYNSIDKNIGYNITTGGERCTFTDEIKNKISIKQKQFYSIPENIKMQTLSQKTRKKVYAYDKNNNLINEFDSIREASRWREDITRTEIYYSIKNDAFTRKDIIFKLNK